MRVSKFLFVTCFICVSSFVDCNITSRLKDIKVYNYASGMDKLGLNEHRINLSGELNVIRKLIKSGDLVFDVGANIGEWSNHVFSNIDSVLIYSFEPIKFIYDKLRNNLINRNVITYNMALSNTSGSKTFYYYPKISELSGFYDRDILREKFNMKPEEMVVNISTLDSFCDNNNILHIDFLKIDTEGEELNVLLGAKNLISQHRISMIQFEYGGCYVDAKTKLKTVFDFLSGCKYFIFKIFPGGIIKISDWRDELENYQLANYLAVFDENLNN